MTRRRPKAEKDSGAALILAIGFVLAIGAVSGGLAGLATTSMNNRRSLEIARDREYAADGAIEIAIGVARGYACIPTASGVSPTVTIDAIPIRVEWSSACGGTSSILSSDGTSYDQRNVVFSACVDAPLGTTCALSPVIIRAQVNFDPASGPVSKTFVQSWTVNR